MKLRQEPFFRLLFEFLFLNKGRAREFEVRDTENCFNFVHQKGSSMWRKVKGFLLFYRSAVMPSFLIAVAVALLGMKFTDGFEPSLVGKAYFFMSLLWLFLRFQVRCPGEYYFYYNLGLGKLVLWTFSSLISLLLACAITGSLSWLW